MQRTLCLIFSLEETLSLSDESFIFMPFLSFVRFWDSICPFIQSEHTRPMTNARRLPHCSRRRRKRNGCNIHMKLIVTARTELNSIGEHVLLLPSPIIRDDDQCANSISNVKESISRSVHICDTHKFRASQIQCLPA